MTHADELKNSGLKATLPRIKVLEVFQKTKERHMSAEDVFRALLAEHADVGLATVYRVLMQFEQAGILSRNHFETGKAVFELNEGKHHDHLVCLDCGRVEEFFDPEIEKRQKAVAQTAASSSRTTPWRSTRLHQEELRVPRSSAEPAAAGYSGLLIALWWRAMNSV
jgi:Fur family ferric uptake transcriptional regulator